jgi:hypothetical protein
MPRPSARPAKSAALDRGNIENLSTKIWTRFQVEIGPALSGKRQVSDTTNPASALGFPRCERGVGHLFRRASEFYGRIRGEFLAGFHELGSPSAYSGGMESAVTLEYPNGRFHEATLIMRAKLVPGYEFDLYGRHWNAVHMLTPLRGRRGEQPRMLCRSTAQPAPSA